MAEQQAQDDNEFGLEAEELARVHQLRDLVADDIAKVPQFPEVVGIARLARFLRGSAQDVEAAADLFRQFLAWRQESGADAAREDIVTNNLTSFFDFPHTRDSAEHLGLMLTHGMDKEGNPVSFLLAGTVNMAGMFGIQGPEGVRTIHLYVMEYFSLLLDRLSRQQRRMVYLYAIRDLGGLGLGSIYPPALPTMRPLGAISRQFYPELMRKLVLTHIPWAFKVLWAIVSPWMNEGTLAKVAFHHGDEHKEPLLQDVAADQLPAFWGGSCACGLCSNLQAGVDPDAARETVLEVAVARKGKETVAVPVAAGGEVMWEIECDGSIATSVRLRRRQQEAAGDEGAVAAAAAAARGRQVQESSKVKEDRPVVGQCMVGEEGEEGGAAEAAAAAAAAGGEEGGEPGWELVFTLDNSAYRMRAKRVTLRVLPVPATLAGALEEQEQQQAAEAAAAGEGEQEQKAVEPSAVAVEVQ